MAGAIPTYSPALGTIAADALRKITAKPVIKQAASTAPTIFTSLKNALSKLWSNKGIQFGSGLAASGVGISILGSQTQEVTKPLGQLGGISGSLLAIGIIVVVVILFFARGK